METYYKANGNSEGIVKTLLDIWTIRIQAPKYVIYMEKVQRLSRKGVL